MPSQNLQQSIRISIIVLVAFLLRRSFDLRRRQHVAFESRLLQLVAKNETVSRRLVDDHYFCVASCLPPLFQIFDHLSSAGSSRRETFSLGRFSIQRDLVYKRLVMRITSNENVVQASSPYWCLWFLKKLSSKRTFLFYQTPWELAFPLLHGELLEGGERLAAATLPLQPLRTRGKKWSGCIHQR